MKSQIKFSVIIPVLCFIVFPAEVAVAVPMGTAFTYQGRLMDANSAADGLYDFQFKLYNAPDDDIQLDGDVNKPDVDVIDGYFTVELDFGSDVFDGNSVWLEIGVRQGDVNDAYTILYPRQEVTPTPYALQTRGIFVSSSGTVGIGTKTPDRNLDIRHSNTGGGIEIDRSSGTIWSGLVYENDGEEKWFVGVKPDSNNLLFKSDTAGVSMLIENETGNVGMGTTTPGFPLTFPNTLGDKISLYGQSGDHYGFGIQSGLLQIHTAGSNDDIALGFVSGGTFNETVRFEGNGEVGIGTANPDRNLDIRHSNSGGGIEIDRSVNTIWSGVVYENSGAENWFIGVQADSDNLLFKDNAAGISMVIEDGTGDVGIGTTSPDEELTVVGTIKASNAEPTGRAVYGNASDTGIGENYGGYFEAHGSYGRGVYGTADATSYGCAGVYGETTWGSGVEGRSYRGSGVYAYSETTEGIAIKAYNSGGGYAGYFDGDVQVTGYLYKMGGGFQIDHPLEPENKYLCHSFVESPDMMNVYNGNVVLDGDGQAWVQLPEYFDVLNRDFRYQLTAIGAPAPNLYIAEKISDNRFRIAGGKSGMEVSWQVTGIRQDPYAVAHRIRVEEDKPAEERGYYLHPKAYGLPEERNIRSVHSGQFPKNPQVAKKTN